MNAASGRASIADPAQLRVNLVDSDGSVRALRLTDTPNARVTMAMQERYRDDTRKYVGASMRVFALVQMLQKGNLSRWIRRNPLDPDLDEVSDSVVEAAASVRLTRNHTFPKREFLRKVREIDAQKREGAA